MSSDLLIMSGGSGGTLPQTIAKTSHQWVDSYTASTGLFTESQPAFADLSDETAGTAIVGLSELDVTTLKISASTKDITLSRSAAASLAVVGSPSIKGSYSGLQIATPATPTVTPTLGSATTWGYKIVARDGLGQSIASTEGTTTTGASTLDSTHFNTVTWAAIVGSVSYDIYRTTVGTSPTTTGKLGNVLADAALSFVDNAVAGDATAVPTIATTGVVACAPAGLAAGDGAYMWAMDIDDGLVGATQTAISAIGANAVEVFMFMCRRTITIRNAVFMNGTTVVAASKAQFGIYDINKNLLIDTGPFSTAVASQTLSNNILNRAGSATAVTLYAGEMYYYAQSATDTTVTGLCNYAINTNTTTNARNKNIVRNGKATNSLSGNQLPMTLGVLTANTNRVPLLVLFES